MKELLKRHEHDPKRRKRTGTLSVREDQDHAHAHLDVVALVRLDEIGGTTAVVGERPWMSGLCCIRFMKGVCRV